MKHTLARILVVLAVAVIGTGCGSDTRQRGAAVAKQGVETAQALRAFYEDLHNAQTEFMALQATQSGQASMSPTEREALRQAQAAVRTHIGERLAVAKAMEKAYGSLGTLSEYDARTAASGAATGLGQSLNGLSGIAGGPTIPVGLFGWFIGEIQQAEQNHDIERGARALRWAVHDFGCVFELEGKRPPGSYWTIDDLAGSNRTSSGALTFNVKDLEGILLKGSAPGEGLGPYAQVYANKTETVLTALLTFAGDPSKVASGDRYVQFQPFGDLLSPTSISVETRTDLNEGIREISFSSAVNRTLTSLGAEFRLIGNSQEALGDLLLKHDELFKPGPRPRLSVTVPADLAECLNK